MRQNMISPTSMANMAYWNYLPMAMTNFGGDIQVFPVDTSLCAPVGMIYNSPAMAQLYQPTLDWGMPPCPILGMNYFA
jgi:hypothetical protein